LGQKQGQSAAAAQGQGQALPLNQVFPAPENLGGIFFHKLVCHSRGCSLWYLLGSGMSHLDSGNNFLLNLVWGR
jgi:hypothetical protein